MKLLLPLMFLFCLPFISDSQDYIIHPGGTDISNVIPLNDSFREVLSANKPKLYIKVYEGSSYQNQHLILFEDSLHVRLLRTENNRLQVDTLLTLDDVSEMVYFNQLQEEHFTFVFLGDTFRRNQIAYTIYNENRMSASLVSDSDLINFSLNVQDRQKLLSFHKIKYLIAQAER